MTAFAAPPRVSELDQLSAAKFGPFGLRAGRREPERCCVTDLLGDDHRAISSELTHFIAVEFLIATSLTVLLPPLWGR